MPPQKLPKGHAGPARDPAPDPRFAPLQTDPRYRPPSAKRARIKLDHRLGGILRDDAFARKAKVDRYGRKVGAGQGRRELERLYRLASDDEEERGEEKSVKYEKESRELRRAQGDYDPAREGGFSTSDSEDDSEDESDDEAADEDVVEGALPEAAAEVPTGEATSRLAVVNLDWDNIRAQDIMAVAASFVPEGGRILDVAIYPSEFGRERMEREEMEGPPREIFQPQMKGKRLPDKPVVTPVVDVPAVDSDNSSSEDEEIKKKLLQEDEGVDFDSTALRQYQLERLRYFYAVIQCSSVGVARALYDSMDGHEYLSSANFFDMRFIPENVDFDMDCPRETCAEIAPGYKPTEFTTDALMHSNVKLTWDADDTKRKDVQKRAFSRKEIDENDLLAYIGSGSSSEGEDDGEEFEGWDDDNADARSAVSRTTTQQSRRDNLRAALGLDSEPLPSEKKKKKEERHVGDMQITFTPALSVKQGDVFANDPTAAETTAQRYTRKERERKAARKERAKARRAGEVPAEEPENGVEKDAAEKPDQEGDLWDDPFFDDPSKAISESRKERRERKKKAAEEKRAAEEDGSNKAELELVMMDDGDASKGGRHFDIKAIERAEKGAKKKAKAKKSKDAKKADTEAKDDFDINVKDPRFNRLFEDPTFAIDPSSHKFRDTKGMRAILSEKRKRVHDPSYKTEGGKTLDQSRIKDRDLMDLVAKAKKVKR
jgi:hypothetical protein